jgi:hypothetical protein
VLHFFPSNVTAVRLALFTTLNRCMFDIFHNLNVSLRHAKVSTPAADWGLVFLYGARTRIPV